MLWVLCFAVVTAALPYAPVSAEAAMSAAHPAAETTSGPVFGFSANGTDAFRGIPYAAAPTGDNRFRPPQPWPTPWTIPRDATQFGASCVQMGSPNTNVPGEPNEKAWNSINLTDSSEDCLFINIYTPAGASANASKVSSVNPLPVMFYMHAGEFRFGSSNDAESEWPYFDIQHNIILVTVNVRLGLFGFAAMDSLRHRDPSNSTGNYGMQDLRAALQWVQKNIHAFGGDPERVTIFGESSGGSSVAFHLTSKKSRGLFHRAIMESPGVTQTKSWYASNTNTEFAVSVLAASGSPHCAFPESSHGNSAFRSITGLTTILGRNNSLEIASFSSRSEAQNSCLANPKCTLVATRPKGIIRPGQLESVTIGGEALKAGNLKDVELYIGNVSLYGLGDLSKFTLDIRLADPLSAEECLVSATAVDLVSVNGAPPFDDSFFTDASAPTIDGVELMQPLSDLSHSKLDLPDNVNLLAGANLDEGTEFMMDAPPLKCDANDQQFLDWCTEFYGPKLGPLVPELYSHPEMPAPLCPDPYHPKSKTSIQWQGAMRSAGDSTMVCPTREMLSASAALGNSVFWYFFVATPIHSVNMEDLEYYGSFHGAEVPFVFGDQFELSSSGERALSRTMGCFWTNFAASGDPNQGPGDCAKHLNLPHWPAMNQKGTSGGNAVILSNTSVTVRQNLKQNICDTFAMHRYGRK